MSDLQRVGPVYGGSGTAAPFTAGVTGAQRIQDAHGRYADAVRNGNVWTLTTPYAGVTLVAASAIGQAAWSPIVGIYNPLGNKYNFNILLGLANYISGTPTAGGIVWGFIPPNAGITSGGGNGAVNALSLNTGGSTARTFIMSAMTGSAASVILAPFPVSPFAGAIAATTPLGSLWEVAAMFNCPPGGAIGITGTLGTATLMQGFLAWEEVPAIT